MRTVSQQVREDKLAPPWVAYEISVMEAEIRKLEATIARVEAQQQSWDIEVEKLYAQNFDTTASAVASCSEDILQAIKGGK